MIYSLAVLVLVNAGAPAGDGPDAQELVRQGLEAMAKNKDEDAHKLFGRASAREKDWLEADRFRGSLAVFSLKAEEALHDFNEVLRLDPKNGEAYAWRGMAHALKASAHKDAWIQALKDFDHAEKLQPKSAVVHWG